MSLAEALALRQKRAKVLEDARALDAKARGEKRTLLGEEQRQFDEMMADYDKWGALVVEMENAHNADKRRSERLAAAEVEQRTLINEMTHRPGAVPPANSETDRDRADRIAIRNLCLGISFAPVHLRAAPQNSAGDNVAGGYTMQPPKFMAELLKDVNDLTFMESICRVINVTDETPVYWPRRDTRLTGAKRGGENTQPPKVTGPTFSKRALKPTKLQAETAVSNVWLRGSGIPAESLLLEELAYEFAVGSEGDWMTGSGSELEPQGIFTASDNGIPTTRDSSTGNTATTVTADGLWTAFYQVKPQYRGRLVTVGSRPLSLQMRTLKNGDGTYIWAPGINAQAPDSVFGRPYYESEFCPQTFTTGKYVACTFDPMQYVIVRKPELEIQRLVEDRAREDITVFLARMWNDGMPVTPEAFVRHKLG